VTRVRAPTTGRLASHLARLFIPCQDPHGACSLIRDLSGEGDPVAKRQRVHIDAPDDISVADKRASGIAAAPHPPLAFLFPAAYRTLAARPPLRTSEAHDASYLCFVREIGDVLPLPPLRHALIVMAPMVLVAHAIRVADE
jgi:hypothetical protein